MRARVTPLKDPVWRDVGGWVECANNALEPNPFFEPDWLMPAVEYLGVQGAALVMAEHGGRIEACVPYFEAQASGPRATRQRRILYTRVVPAAIAVGTPLVTPDGGLEALACVMDELGRQARCRGADLVVWEWLAADGQVVPLLRQAAAGSGTSLASFDWWERGLLRRQRDSSGKYWLDGIGGHRQRTIRQHANRLAAALGTEPMVRVRTDFAAADAFVRLEASGWKGDGAGMAFDRQPGTRLFFTTVCERYLARGRMWFLSLEGPAGPLAMLCCIRSGEGVFAYRTAYDEEYARFGPGVQVFLAAMEHFDQGTDAAWMDCCSASGNQHLLGLFPDRRTITTMISRVRARPHEHLAVPIAGR